MPNFVVVDAELLFAAVVVEEVNDDVVAFLGKEVVVVVDDDEDDVVDDEEVVEDDDVVDDEDVVEDDVEVLDDEEVVGSGVEVVDDDDDVPDFVAVVEEDNEGEAEDGDAVLIVVEKLLEEMLLLIADADAEFANALEAVAVEEDTELLLLLIATLLCACGVLELPLVTADDFGRTVIDEDKDLLVDVVEDEGDTENRLNTTNRRFHYFEYSFQHENQYSEKVSGNFSVHSLLTECATFITKHSLIKFV